MEDTPRRELVVAAIVGVVVFGGIGYKLLAGANSVAEYDAAGEIHGSIVVTEWEQRGDECVGAGHVDDLFGGTPIAIVTDAGIATARSSLVRGRPVGDTCLLDFRILGANLDSPTQRIQFGDQSPVTVATGDARWGIAIQAG